MNIATVSLRTTATINDSLRHLGDDSMMFTRRCKSGCHACPEHVQTLWSGSHLKELRPKTGKHVQVRLMCIASMPCMGKEALCLLRREQETAPGCVIRDGRATAPAGR